MTDPAGTPQHGRTFGLMVKIFRMPNITPSLLSLLPGENKPRPPAKHLRQCLSDQRSLVTYPLARPQLQSVVTLLPEPLSLSMWQ